MILALMPLSASAASRVETDADAVEIYRRGMRRTVDAVREVAADDRKKQMLSADEKTAVRAAWNSFLDYLLALDSLGAYHRDLAASRGSSRERELVVSYAAFLAQYRGALEMIDATSELPGADAVLNEAVPSIGLPYDTYARVKFRWLNVARATEFAALESLYLLSSGTSFPTLRAAIDEDRRYVLKAGRGKGPVQTAANAMKIAKSTAFTAWFPVQKGVAEWMGDTRVARGERFLINNDQIKTIARKLEPGDVMLERREWYVSNVGLPGYWPHTALYIGDPSERRAFFNDNDVRAWVREQGGADGDFDAYLRDRYSNGYARATAENARVIEAISEGVSLTTIEHSAGADSLAVLRPRTSKRAKAIAIARAFAWLGKPYDFDFDSHTDEALVCSELVYKAYEPALTLPLEKTWGRLTTPPNEIAHSFDSTFGTPQQQFDFVTFYDGHERESRAVEATVAEFRQSWTRPKWHVLTR